MFFTVVGIRSLTCLSTHWWNRKKIWKFSQQWNIDPSHKLGTVSPKYRNRSVQTTVTEKLPVILTDAIYRGKLWTHDLVEQTLKRASCGTSDWDEPLRHSWAFMYSDLRGISHKSSSLIQSRLWGGEVWTLVMINSGLCELFFIVFDLGTTTNPELYNKSIWGSQCCRVLHFMFLEDLCCWETMYEAARYVLRAHNGIRYFGFPCLLFLYPFIYQCTYCTFFFIIWKSIVWYLLHANMSTNCWICAVIHEVNRISDSVSLKGIFDYF